MHILDLFGHEFMQYALLAGLAISAVCAVIGVFIVQRGLSFLGDGLAHAAFGGIAISLYLGASVERAVWYAIPFTAVIALGIGYVLRRTQLRGDVATGVFFAFAFALGILFLQLRNAKDGVQTVNVENLLFGRMLSVTGEVLAVVVAVSIIGLVVMTAIWSRLAYAIFDAELAAISGVKVAVLEYVLLFVTAIVVVVGVKAVGVVLVSSFVIIPAATARLVGTTMFGTTAIALLIGMVGAGVGLVASFYLNMNAGATIILLHSAGFLLAMIYVRLKR